ncbi:putative mucin-associated surface protein (MASP), partial [Trypanosoma cruzi]
VLMAHWTVWEENRLVVCWLVLGAMKRLVQEEGRVLQVQEQHPCRCLGLECQGQVMKAGSYLWLVKKGMKKKTWIPAAKSQRSPKTKPPINCPLHLAALPLVLVKTPLRWVLPALNNCPGTQRQKEMLTLAIIRAMMNREKMKKQEEKNKKIKHKPGLAKVKIMEEKQHHHYYHHQRVKKAHYLIKKTYRIKKK